MSTQLNYPPKIICPGTAKILKRERLFKNLDEARQQSKLIWIAAPAGSGKTTLVSSYIQEHQLLHCWYQVDEGDQDLATFFHYMGQAGNKAAPRRKKSMTALTGEFLQNITAFTRCFFGDISSRLKGDGVIVLDNFQLFPESHPIHALLPSIADSLGEGISLIILGRQLPPKSLISLLIRGQLTTLDTSQIRFNNDEWSSVCKLLKPESRGDALLSLHDKLDGWIAGLLLSINAPEVFDNIPPEMAQTNVLEEYVADEFLNSLDAATNEVLMSVCYMPHITQASVHDLVKIDQPHKILAELARRNLFILRQGTKGYTLHPLVQAHLKRKIENTLSKQAQHDLLQASAKAMLAQNEYEFAADLLLELQDWVQLTSVILSHSEELYNTGRVVSLHRYISALPRRYSENEPWIDYWNGNLLAYRDVESALEFFDRAYTDFLSNADAKGAYFTWHAALSAIGNTLQAGDQMVVWLNRYDELSNKWPQPPQELNRCDVANMLAKCYFLTDVDAQKREFWRNEIARMINETDSAELRLRLMSNYLIIAAISGIREQDILIFERLEKFLSGKNEIPAIIHIDAAVTCIIFVLSLHAHEKSSNLSQQTLEIAKLYGVSVFNGLIYMGVILSAVNLKKYSLANELINKAKIDMPEGDIVYQSSYLAALLHAGTYMDNVNGINEIVRQHLGGLDGAVLPAFEIHVKLAYLYYLCARSQTDEALMLHDALLERVTKQALPAQLSRFHMIYAKIFFNEKLFEKSDHHLEKSIKALSKENIISYYYWPSELMSWACQRALSLNIEISYVQRFVSRHYAVLPAPDVRCLKWPWAFRLHTFGPFELVRNEAVDYKVQRNTKSLQLLKTLAVAEKNTLLVSRIKEILYENCEYDKASQLLDNHLHRLRRSLGCDEAIIREGDKISLNPQYFWVDKNVFEILQKQKITRENAPELIAQLQGIYRGEYMPEDDSIDCIAHRERYRNLFMSVLFKCLDFMESDTESAIEVCLQALVQEPFSEPLYRKLIGLYLHTGNRDMAETTLSQCRSTLQRHQNKDVSEKTLSLLSTA